MLVFSPDGSRLYAAAYVTPPRQFLVDVAAPRRARSPRATAFPGPRPTSTRMACGVNGETVVSDLSTGRVRFRLPGIVPFWSARGWLTAAPDPGHSTGTAVVADAAGVTRARIAGLARGWSPDGRLLVLQRGRSLWAVGPGARARAHRLLADWSGAPLSFSPDGRSVTTESGGASVRVPLAGGRAVRGLGFGAGVWSRDGRLAYTDIAGAPGSTRRPGVEIAVFVTDVHGRNPRIAGRFPFDDRNYRDLRWLPDGRRVLFVTGTTCGGSGLYAVPATGGAVTSLTRDPRALEDPVWSPDGGRIAYSVQNFTCHLGAGMAVHIASAAPDGSRARRVTDDGDRERGSFDRYPSYSPDGRRIVFAHGSADTGSLQIVAATGGKRLPLPAPGGRDVYAEPAWSPDGSRIAYAEGHAIVAVAPRGGAREVVATGLPAVVCGTGGLAWSPDGRRLAVARGAGIYVIAVGDPASARLAIRVRCAGNPSFSPDGTQIAFDAPPAHSLGDETAIMLAHADGTGVRTLSTVPFRQSTHPAWQPAR